MLPSRVDVPTGYVNMVMRLRLEDDVDELIAAIDILVDDAKHHINAGDAVSARSALLRAAGKAMLLYGEIEDCLSGL